MKKIEKKSVLVVGSLGHSLADLCVKWGTEFYVGDYDVIIFTLKDLTPELIGYFRDNKPDYLEDIRKHLVEAQQKGLQVFCILEPNKLDPRVRQDDVETRKRWSNYSWSPIVPDLEAVAEGKKINFAGSKIFPDYLKLVKGASILFNSALNNTGYPDNKVGGNSIVLRTSIDTVPLLTNSVDRTIAFKTSWRVSRLQAHTRTLLEVVAQATAPMVFLPQIENIKEGIDIILLTVTDQVAEIPPDWVTGINVGNEDELSIQILEKGSKIEALKNEVIAIEAQKAELAVYKKLLYASGDNLEEIVEKSLGFLGVVVTPPAVKGKEDRLFIKDDAAIPIEIRGKNSGLNEKDLNQLTSRFVDKPESAKYQTRGLFVLNHFRDIEPTKREAPFNVNIIEKAIPWKVCLITGITLYELVQSKLAGKKIDNLDQQIFNTIGVFKINGEDIKK